MQNTTLEYLPGSNNEWMRIFKESTTLEEMLMATYSRAMENDVFCHYMPRNDPPQPSGWFQTYQDYISLKTKEKKTEAWRAILEDFGGYLKACSTEETENISDYCFLREMGIFFKQHGMTDFSERCTIRMREFIPYFSEKIRKMLGV